jgi:hypothetical protein
MAGMPLLGAERLEQFTLTKSIHLCNSCGYHLECRGQFVQIQERGRNIRAFRIGRVLELREHRPGDCDTEPKQD